MALLGIITDFEAAHGSREIRKSRFTVEMVLTGSIRNGFVAGVDYVEAKERLDGVLCGLSGTYLDDIVGRATNENIAQYIMFNLNGVPLQSIRISEGNGIYVDVSAVEFNAEVYPAQLSFNLGHSFLLRENPEKAKIYFTEAINLDNGFADAYNLRGRCFKYLNNYKSALDDFLRAIEINPKLGEAWRNLGNAYLYLERFDEMIPAFDKGVELMPDSALAINNRGYGFFRIGNYRFALRDHERAIEIDPKYAEAYYDRAMALKSMGRDREAEVDLTKSEMLKQSKQDTYQGVKMY